MRCARCSIAGGDEMDDLSDIAYRHDRASWSLRIFWRRFVRSKREYDFFVVGAVISVSSLMGHTVASSSTLQNVLWVLSVLSTAFVVATLLAIVRHSVVDARHVSEARASIDSVASMLIAGQLDETTLVDVGGGWRAISD
ncbi:MAG: hypothetical protein QM817_15045 [Archangium sp.]